MQYGYNKTFNKFTGNKNLHLLTSKQSYQRRIDMKDLDGVNCYVKYQNFSVDSKANEYRLTLGDYEGECGKLLKIYITSKTTKISKSVKQQTSCHAVKIVTNNIRLVVSAMVLYLR